jgi:hypothetical protein
MEFDTDRTERLALIVELADALTNHGGEGWHLAYAIRELAKGYMTPAEAIIWTSEN